MNTSGAPAIVFDDSHAQASAGGGGGVSLSPLTDLRPAFAVRTGAMTTRQRWTRTMGVRFVGLWVSPRHAALARVYVEPGSTGPLPVNDAKVDPRALGSHDGTVLIINGRCVLPPGTDALRSLGAGDALIEPGSRQIVAMRATPEQAAEAFRAGEAGLTGPTWPAPARTREVAEPCLMHRPWHVRTFRDTAIALDLKHLSQFHVTAETPTGCLRFGEGVLSIRPGAKVYPGVTLDLEHGPIVIDEGAVIRPGVTIIGPAYIGAGTTILDKAIIKAQTAIGPQCKIAGEVGGTIFHGFANKAHDGHLGDSWIGKWSNLGAGTTNSNLLNTYGVVTMRATPGASMERTGQQFMGCILGDHVKTAICTRIMTGAILGTGVMYAATLPATGTIGAFSWCVDREEGAEAKPQTFRVDKFIDIARTVMSRRKVTPGEEYIAAVKALHAGM